MNINISQQQEVNVAISSRSSLRHHQDIVLILDCIIALFVEYITQEIKNFVVLGYYKRFLKSKAARKYIYAQGSSLQGSMVVVGCNTLLKTL